MSAANKARSNGGGNKAIGTQRVNRYRQTIQHDSASWIQFMVHDWVDHLESLDHQVQCLTIYQIRKLHKKLPSLANFSI